MKCDVCGFIPSPHRPKKSLATHKSRKHKTFTQMNVIPNINKTDTQLVEYLLKTGWFLLETKTDTTDLAMVLYFRKDGNRDLVFTIEHDEPVVEEDPLTLY